MSSAPPPAPPIHAPKRAHYHVVSQEEEDVWTPSTNPTIITTRNKSSSSSAKLLICVSVCLSILMFLLGGFLGAFVHAVLYPDGGSPISNLILIEYDSLAANDSFVEQLYDEITNEKLVQPTNEEEPTTSSISTTEIFEPDPSETTSQKPIRECFNMTWSRLPRSFQPIEYRLQIHPNLTTNIMIARVVIDVLVVQKSDELVLNAEDLIIKNFEIRRVNKNQILEARLTECNILTMWSWKLKKHIKAGEKLEISIEYETEMLSDLQGLYISTHIQNNGNRRKSAATQFEPTFARKMLPCFDEPDFKSHFIVSIIREPQHISRSNMPIKESNYLENNGLYEDVFEKSVKMSTYLLAVAILDDYSYVRRLTRETKKPIEVRLYAPTDVIDGQAEFGLDTGIRAIEFFENYFNISYPLEKIDLLALDDFSEGAMENWGLVTFRDSALLFDKNKASVVAKEHIALIICHEIAHQWFGNLVTMTWWNELYLNEGFANYMEYKCVDNLFPKWNIMRRFYAENVAFSHEPDGLLTTRAIESDDQDSIMNLFDAINYHKAAAIIHMIAEFAGQQNFQKALIEYLNKFAYSNAKGVELWRIVEKHANPSTISIPELAKAYTSQIGYPLVIFETKDDEAIIYNQTRFTFLQNESIENKESWPIPISYRVEGDDNVKTHWLLPNRTHETWQIASNNESWTIVNTGGVGYFKVQYDAKMYERFRRQLRTNHSQIAPIDRAMLLVDTFDLSRAGRLGIDVYLNIVEYAEAEQDKMTWTIINKHLQTIEILIEDTAHLGTFRDFQRSLILPLYESFSWHQQPSTSPTRKGLQIETFEAACRLSVIDCINQAHRVYRQHGHKIRNPELAGIVLAEGIRRYGRGAWEHIWDTYNMTNSPAERNIILNSLASVKDPKLINRLLHFCLDGQIKLNLIPRVFSSLSRHSIGRSTAWRFFKINYDKFQKLMGFGSSPILSTCIQCLAEPLSTKQDLDELKGFLREKGLYEREMKMDQTYEQVELNIQWRRLNEQKIGEWLNNWDNKRTSFDY